MPYSQTRWSLDALLASTDSEAVDKAFAVFERKVKKVEGWRRRLKASLPAKAFAALLDDYEAMQVESLRLGSFSDLRF